MLVFDSATAAAAVDVANGGRLASLRIESHEVLVTPDPDPMRWGCYPMVPFAGRIRRGRFSFDGLDHLLPPNLGPHAIHGYGFTSPWDLVDDHTIAWEFSPPWPYAGRATQRFELTDTALVISLTAYAGERQPLMVGWHPWFCRDIGAGPTVDLSFGPARMYELDDEAIPTGRLVDPSPGPWDNCFVELAREPVLRWGSGLELRLSASTAHWVIFTEPDNAICVEPQSGAPDEINRSPRAVEAGEALTATFTIAWGPEATSRALRKGERAGA